MRLILGVSLHIFSKLVLGEVLQGAPELRRSRKTTVEATAIVSSVDTHTV